MAGVFLRLSFPGDVEYKEDEQTMFQAAQKMGVTEPWPSLGMMAGVGGIKNPALSMWIFGALSRITGASTPIELSRAVQLLNVLALFLLAFFSFRLLPEAERKPWLWATAFAAVNPFTVLFERKIWAQDTLPIFCVLFWMAWHYRRKPTGTFCWGLIGIGLGQIHMSGFFLAAGVFLWTFFHDKEIRWRAWGLGSFLGVLPLIPWLQQMAGRTGGGGFDWKSHWWIFYPKYWIYWLTDSLGLGLNYSLSQQHFSDYLGYPLVGGQATYLVGVAHVLLIAAAVWLLVSAKKAGGEVFKISSPSETALILNAVIILTGILFTLIGIRIRRHYLIMTFPLEWVWLSRLGLSDSRRGQLCLGVIWAAQLFISALFLWYIHVNQGDSSGDYGIAYQFQTK